MARDGLAYLAPGGMGGLRSGTVTPPPRGAEFGGVVAGEVGFGTLAPSGFGFKRLAVSGFVVGRPVPNRDDRLPPRRDGFMRLPPRGFRPPKPRLLANEPT